MIVIHIYIFYIGFRAIITRENAAHFYTLETLMMITCLFRQGQMCLHKTHLYIGMTPSIGVRDQFRLGGAEFSCPNIFSIACPKIKWFCPNIT